MRRVWLAFVEIVSTRFLGEMGPRVRFLEEERRVVAEFLLALGRDSLLDEQVARGSFLLDWNTRQLLVFQCPAARASPASYTQNVESGKHLAASRVRGRPSASA